MNLKRRWLKATLEETKNAQAKLPWARGAERAAWKSRCAARAMAEAK